jgi:uroporphyrin-III C-methyltransferase / precorrin-2 dehydrogenase / sirohydrochlorin ferrochelatase
LVFALTKDSQVNAEISLACRQHGIWCNRADQGQAGEFQVPGVVRRGKVTLTASTGGTVPGLTRWMKRHLEGLFGEELPLLARVLGEWRSAQKSLGWNDEKRSRMENLDYQTLVEAAKQGEAVLRLAFQEQWARPESGASTSPIAAMPISQIPPLQPVVLLGAGPGHPGLLTQLGAEALKRAQIVLHDRLIPPEILALVPSDGRLIPVEKRGHQESMRQEHIHEMLIAHARTGLRVVRLKGGDPFIFGRGQEEILALEAAGIPWQVIPGISSALAAPAWAGIPLTHRGIARSFAVMTGTTYDAPNPDIPKADTLVILMGLQKWNAIVTSLLAAGYPLSTPAAAIEKGTRSDQRVCVGTLDDLEGKMARAGFDSPTLLVIGAVAQFAGHPSPLA